MSEDSEGSKRCFWMLPFVNILDDGDAILEGFIIFKYNMNYR